MRRERLTVYCYQRPDAGPADPWFLAIRTPDRLLWKWKETFPTREAVEQAAQAQAARCESAWKMTVEIAFEVPVIDPNAVGTVDFVPANREERRGGRKLPGGNPFPGRNPFN